MSTTTEIDAPCTVVWEVLTDFTNYHSWNPFIKSAEGVARMDVPLRLQLPAGYFEPRITQLQRTRTLQWTGTWLTPGMLLATHRFDLRTTINGGTKVVHTQQMRGFAAVLAEKDLKRTVKQGFEEMDKALKMRAENMTIQRRSAAAR